MQRYKHSNARTRAFPLNDFEKSLRCIGLFPILGIQSLQSSTHTTIVHSYHNYPKKGLAYEKSL